MFGSAEWSKTSNNPQCKQQMLDWIKARWTESVYSSPMQSHPFSLCCWGQIHPFFWHATLASLHNDEPALLLSPRIITCDRRTDAQFFFLSLCFSTLAGFSLFFPPSLPGFVSGCCSLMHSQNWSTVSLSDEFNGFSAAWRKAERFSSVCFLSLKIGFLWLCF